jgi:hypothetical protein
MKIDTIYLDLDDVCNTLSPFLLRWLNVPVEPTDYSRYPGRMDIVPAANRLLGQRRYTRKTFWEAIPRRAWVECPESDFFHWLLRACKRITGRSIYIATATTKDPDCLAGKLEWIHAHFPKWMHRQYFITPRKWKLGKPGSLLIDDNEKNCRLFEEAGGLAIRVPRPWNDAAAFSPREYLEPRLKNLS